MKRHVVIGDKFERLEVIEQIDKIFYKCRCDCGGIKVARKYNLIKGYTKSCGCIRSDSKKKHGLPRDNLYFIWANMRQRCRNQKHRDYNNYGGRGIGVCPEWDNYVAFYNWSMQNGYSPSLSLDRINNDAGYSPNNCRWADRCTQNNNKRINIKTVIDGRELTLMEISRKYEINYGTVSNRYKKGKRGSELVSKVG